MHPFFTNLKNQASENPMVALAAVATTLTAVAQFVGSAVGAKNSRTWRKEVKRREKKDSQS